MTSQHLASYLDVSNAHHSKTRFDHQTHKFNAMKLAKIKLEKQSEKMKENWSYNYITGPIQHVWATSLSVYVDLARATYWMDLPRTLLLLLCSKDQFNQHGYNQPTDQELKCKFSEASWLVTARYDQHAPDQILGRLD